MKKTKLVSILLVSLLALTLVLTACNNAKTLSKGIRWETNETTVYQIGLQDTTSETNTKIYDEQSFTRDTVTTPAGYDRIMPTAVTGTYTTTLTINSDDTATYTTTQVVTETYSQALYAGRVAELFQLATENAFLNATDDGEGNYTFTSTTTSSVTFVNDATQQPVSSTQTIQGYYLGKSNIEVNNVTYATTYSEGVATVTMNDKQVFSGEVAEGVVDALQIALVVRSIDQSQSTAEGKYVAPSVSVFDFKSYQTVALSITIYNKMNVLLNLGNDYPYAVASVVTVGVQGYTGFLYTFTSNPNETFSEDISGVEVNTYKQVRFQSEYYTYEVESYTADEVEDLKYVVAPETAE